MKRFLLVATTGVVAVVAAACALTALATGNPDPKQMVLRLQDMPTGFSLKSAKSYNLQQAAADDPKTGLAGYRAWGFVAGYDVDYALSGGGLVDTLTGPVEILSRASVYKTSAGATASFRASAAVCAKPPFTPVAVGATLGDQAAMCSYTQTSNNITGLSYVVVWHRGRFKGQVILAATKTGASASQAVRLAETQNSRMRG